MVIQWTLIISCFTKVRNARRINNVWQKHYRTPSTSTILINPCSVAMLYIEVVGINVLCSNHKPGH